MQKLFKVFFLACFIFLIVLAYHKHTLTRMVARESEIPVWESDTHEIVNKSSVINLLQHSTNYRLQNNDIKKTIIIPGIRGAWSIDSVSKKPSFGTYWTPQGLTQSDRYYFVSMYDSEHIRNSLVMVIDKSSGNYVKSLILPTKAHVGGLAFDNVSNRLWFSNDTKKYARLSYISYAKIIRYKAAKIKAPIQSSGTLKLPWASRTSGITIFKDDLVIVKYGKNRNSRSIINIPLETNRIPSAISSDQLAQIEVSSKLSFLNELVKQNIIKSYSDGWDRMQGVAVSSNGLMLLAQSNGRKNSRILYQVITGENVDTSPKDHKTTLMKVPNSIEQISLNKSGSEFSLLFESGARQYRERSKLIKKNIIDRIIVIDIKIDVN